MLVTCWLPLRLSNSFTELKTHHLSLFQVKYLLMASYIKLHKTWPLYKTSPSQMAYKPTFGQITRPRFSHLLSQEQNSSVDHIYFDLSQRVLSLQWSSLEIFTLAKPVENWALCQAQRRSIIFDYLLSIRHILFESNTKAFTREKRPPTNGSTCEFWRNIFHTCLLFVFHFRHSSLAVDQTMPHFQVYKHRHLCSRSASLLGSEDFFSAFPGSSFFPLATM